MLVAGATGAIGWPLVAALVARGHPVVGTTRSTEKAERLAQIGAVAAVVDVYDRDRLARIVQAHRPAIVVHQLTDLPYGVPREQMAAGRERNDRIRLVGTRNLLDAIGRTPIRLIVQSIAFAYADGPLPHSEEDALGSAALESFERMVLESPHDSTILRYGRFYGDRTGVARVDASCRVSVSAAVEATMLALSPLTHPIYNVCEDAEYADNRRFILETGWVPSPAASSRG